MLEMLLEVFVRFCSNDVFIFSIFSCALFSTVFSIIIPPFERKKHRRRGNNIAKLKIITDFLSITNIINKFFIKNLNEDFGYSSSVQ